MISLPSKAGFLESLDAFQRSTFEFKLSGSHFYGTAGPNSDYDFLINLFPNDSVIGYRDRLKAGLKFIRSFVDKHGGSKHDPRTADSSDSMVYLDINCCAVIQISTFPKIDIIVPCNFYIRSKLDVILKEDKNFLNRYSEWTNEEIQQYVEDIYVNKLDQNYDNMIYEKQKRLDLIIEVLYEIDGEADKTEDVLIDL